MFFRAKFIVQEFHTGSIMTFLLATTDDLGPLQHLHVWHDNSGTGRYASWYLSQILVHDIAKEES